MVNTVTAKHQHFDIIIVYMSILMLAFKTQNATVSKVQRAAITAVHK